MVAELQRSIDELKVVQKVSKGSLEHLQKKLQGKQDKLYYSVHSHELLGTLHKLELCTNFPFVRD